MLSDLLVVNVTQYNGYDFPLAATIETTNYKITPIYDSAKRTVLYSQFDITMRWYLNSDTTTEEECTDMVARLQRPAGVLAYTGRGFGVADIVNIAGISDADWGPRPGPVVLEPIGDGRTIRATWSVTFCLATCPDAISKGVREFCFALDYSIDRSGLTTRTYKGHVSIAQTRPFVNSRTVPDTADRFLELITPAPLLGYRRESQNRSLSEDKSTLHLTVVDVQLPAFAPPTGSVDAQFEHSYSTRNGNVADWVGTFTGTYEVAKSKTTGADTRYAVQDFLYQADNRLKTVATMIRGGGLPALGGPGGGLVGAVVGAAGAAVAGAPIGRTSIIPLSFSVAEPNAYGRRQIRISMSYRIAGIGLSEILTRGGLWAPVGAQYNQWQALTPTLFAPRGEGGLRFSAGDDSLVDLCGETEPKVPGGPAGGTGTYRPPSGPGAPTPPQQPVSPSQGFQQQVQAVFPGPTPQTSWVEYQQAIHVQPDTGRIGGKTLPTAPLPHAPTSQNSQQNSQGVHWDALQGLPSAVPSGSPFPPLADVLANSGQTGSQSSSQTGAPFYQQRTVPALFATLEGWAVRIGFPIPIPELLKVGNMTPVLVGQPQFVQKVVGNALVPVYGASWKLDYMFVDGNNPTVPVPVPPNPYLA